ncbi:hypothetical protein ACH5RR_027149 [Cinchona calisaya]|uniref:ZCF37 n=1 Tax=Cinchona calisaya TaxID=153742 RepID=A0ABD2Z7U4_9GENT
MLNPFVCGSFNNQEEDDIGELLSPCTTPKKSRKCRDSKNPYANQGLDKFSALLAELEGKKQKIYTQKGSQDISFVRFVYSNSNDWKPIVVKANKDRKLETGSNHVDNNLNKDKKMTRIISSVGSVHDKHSVEVSKVIKEVGQPKVEECLIQRPKRKKNIRWSFMLKNLRHPCCYLPILMVFILLFLAMYGRSFAILCTSLGWYLVPMIKERASSAEKTNKDYSRRLSEKNMVNDGPCSPKSVLSGPAEKPIAVHVHRKSW